MRALLACLIILSVAGCGDEYYSVDKPNQLGTGICGQYFLVVKNTENTCGSESDYSYPALIERGEPVEEALSVLTVTPLDIKETDTNFKFLGYSMNGIGVAEDGAFELYLKDSHDTDIYFSGRFFNNKAVIKFEFNVKTKGFSSCRYVFEGIADKYIDYSIPEIPQGAVDM